MSCALSTNFKEIYMYAAILCSHQLNHAQNSHSLKDPPIKQLLMIEHYNIEERTSFRKYDG